MTTWLCLGAAPAAAFEFFDGRLQIHGYYEFQLRSIAREFDSRDGWDVTQMAHILNIEIEGDLAPDGFGPFDLVTLFSRVEVRYDCVWSGACGMFPSVDAFGNDSGKLPKRLNNGRRLGFAGTVPDEDVRYYRGEPPEEFRWPFRGRPRGSRTPYQLPSNPAFAGFFQSEGPDETLGTRDDPAVFVFDRYFREGRRRCNFTTRYSRGPVNGNGLFILGPIDPDCRPEAIAALADKPNPYRGRDFNPLVVTQTTRESPAGTVPRLPVVKPGGTGALPYRPATQVSNTTGAPASVPRGLWYPNAELQKKLDQGYFAKIPHFSQHDLQWNRGLHQKTWRELKELYVDLEMFDSRFWLRLGRQTIVWGKTELFRNQDRFNPQDLALASLPSLEESRTALWSVRGVWSFYDVGPLQDVRLEIAANFDKFLSGDFGQCGEPYTVYLVCAGAFGQLSHGTLGLGLAGAKKVPNGYDDIKGVEIGGRLEWRWDRFSFALTDFWGYDDFPTIERLFRFSRNVDPVSGRPRHTTSEGRCRRGDEPDCLDPGRGALLNHHANQTLFAASCAATVGVSDLDNSACGFNIFNSKQISSDRSDFAPRLMLVFAGQLSGQGSQTTQGFSGAQYFEGAGGFTDVTLRKIQRNAPFHRIHFPTADTLGNLLAEPEFASGIPTILVPLSVDAGDTGVAITPPPPFDVDLFNTVIHLPTALGPYTTPQQQALLGCGPFYHTICDIDGIDFLNMEGSAISQSWVGVEGTSGSWDTRDRSVAQPGTIGFAGGAICTRFERGRSFMLPGCRGPGDSGYNPRIDGTTTGPAFAGFPSATTAPFQRVHPLTGQPFRSEMAVLSWNFMMMLVVNSRGQADGPLNDPPRINTDHLRPDDDEFNPSEPFRKDGCSFAKPQFCRAFRGFLSALAVTRNTVTAGGNGQFGRRDFAWHTGNPVAAVFDKQNVLGFSMDFAEDLTKTNWSFEATWVSNARLGNADEFSGLTNTDLFNLTISVDRPTFINFLNANRTFFFNSQLFIRYISGYENGFSASGPWSFLGTFTAQTGYFQDRLLAGNTFVYDQRSNSGAILPQVTYRFTESFSATFGVAVFFGRFEPVAASINPIGPSNRAGNNANEDFVENGLSVVRQRDEVFLRIRMTF